MLFKRKELPGEGCCRFCRHVTVEEGVYRCHGRREVSPGGVCVRYKFDPFAARDNRRRTLDTSVLDPIDFEI